MGTCSPLGPVAVGRRRLDALVGGLPRVERAAEPHLRRLLPRSGQVAVPVLEQRAGRLRLRVDEEGEHEDLGVPEDVQEVGHAAQAAGADRHGVLGRMRRADHVVDGEAQRVLVVGVAVDAQVGGVPGGVPRRAVPPQQLVVADVARPLQGPARDLRRRHLGARRDDRREPVHRGRVPRLEAPADDVARLLRRARDGRAGRRSGGHREHVPAAVAAARARDQAGRVVEHLELRLPGRPAGVGDADGALPHDRAGEVLRRGLRARGHHLAVGQRGEAGRADADAAAAAQPLAPRAEDDAVAHVQHALVLDDLAVREGHRAAGHHEPEAGPVGRRDRLPEGAGRRSRRRRRRRRRWPASRSRSPPRAPRACPSRRWPP